MTDTPKDTQNQAALAYHQFPKPGKLEIRATKPLANGRDLSLAYSPGVAEASTPPAPISSAWSPTAPPSWASAISARSPPSR